MHEAPRDTLPVSDCHSLLASVNQVLVAAWILDQECDQKLETRASEPGVLQFGLALEPGRKALLLKWSSGACSAQPSQVVREGGGLQLLA